MTGDFSTLNLWVVEIDWTGDYDWRLWVRGLPGVTGRVVDPFGPGGGAMVLELHGERDAVYAAVVDYCRGGDDPDWFFTEYARVVTP